MLNLLLKNGEDIALEKNKVISNFQNNILTFELDNMLHEINLKEKTFKRENKEYLFFLDIENKKCELILKKENYILQVYVEYAILLKNKNKIEISYLIETDDKENKLFIELEE